MKTRREASKCREWEKVRRDKLNDSFLTLSKLLPHHDPSLTLSKIEILRKATVYIEELEQKLKNVLTEEGIKKTEREELRSLTERIKRLLSRNEQLSNLLKDAGIKLPTECGKIKNFKEPLRWSNKITPEQAKKFAEKEAQKENKKETNKAVNKTKGNTVFNKKTPRVAAKHKQKPANRGVKKIKKNNGTHASIINVQLSNILPVVSQANIKTSTPCFIITSNSSIALPINSKTNKSASTVVTNSSTLASPKMASIITPPTSAIMSKVNSTLGSLGPGTLILANGNIVPILPSQTVLPNPSILSNSTPILLKPPNTSNTTLIVMPTHNSTEPQNKKLNSDVQSKPFARIRPKVNVTKTTQVNKVPIPALTSRYSTFLPVNNSMNGKINTDEKRVEVKKCKKVKPIKKRKPATSSASSSEKRQKCEETSSSNTVLECDQVNGQSTISTTPTAAPTNTTVLTTQVECNIVEDKNVHLNDQLVELNVEKDATSQPPDNENKNKINQIEGESDPPVIKKTTPSETTIDNHKAISPTSDAPVLNETTNKLDEKKDGTTNETNLPVEQTTKSSAEVVPEKTTISVSITEMQDKNLECMDLGHSELSNDIFSSLQVPIGGQNPESTSPTAAFLLAFPLVSSLTGVKVTEVIEEENSDSRHGTPTLLQIGTMDTTKTTQSANTESLTANLLNLDNFSFFSGKDNFYSSFDNSTTCLTSNIYSGTSLQVVENVKNSSCRKNEGVAPQKPKIVCEPLDSLIIKPQKENVASAASNTSTPYTPEAQITSKSNVVAQHNFPTQNTSVSYLKVASISSSFVNSSSVVNNFEARQKISCGTVIPPLTKEVTYPGAPNVNRKNFEQVNSSDQYNSASSVGQCNAYNPFSDFSRSSTVHTYSFSKPYGDSLYTNSAHYNYPQNNNQFEQNAYYTAKTTTASKNHNVTYTTPSYTDSSYSVELKGKRELVNHRPGVNYYNQSKPKEKFPNHPSKNPKPVVNQPKPPINWMTTPDFRPQTTNADYLVPPFTKDIEYNPNSFYSTNSFVPTTHTSYFNSTATMYPPSEFQNPITDNRKPFDSIITSTNSAQRSEFEENQFSWSPSKLPQFIETPHSFVSSTLPTLVGDLALGTAQATFVEQKEHGGPREQVIKAKDRRAKVHAVNYDNQSNFLSVSQLVENKTDVAGGSSRSTNRRSSGNRNVKNNATPKINKHSSKQTENKELDGTPQDFNHKIETAAMEKTTKLNNLNNYSMQGVSGNWMLDCNKSNRVSQKNSQTNYSAEALIGHPNQSESSVPKQRYRQQQVAYTPVSKSISIPPFLSDNIVPYFPPVEIPQDNNFIPTNANFQSSQLSHTFPSSVQNPTYTSGTYISTGATITSNYALLPDFGAHDYAASTITGNTVNPTDKLENKHCTRTEGTKHSTSNISRTEERPTHTEQLVNLDCAGTFAKKSKHKHSENNLPGIVDFGFLPMPSTINSPILPDDFHTHSNFLPPPTPGQLYPCKNPLYSKQPSELNSGALLPLPPVPVSRSGPTQHFEGPTGVNSSSSLTSFNLSAIFPEMNKGPLPVPGLYSEPSRNKNYHFQRNYLSGTPQVSSSNKSTYVNAVATHTSYAPPN